MRTINFYLMITAVMLGVSACGDKQEAEKEIIRPVRYEQVFSTGGTRIRTFSGVTQSGQESKLSFKVGGTVENVYVKVGDKVYRGQPLISLDSDDYQLQVQEAEASLQQAKAQERQATANYERVRQLYENRNASRNDLDAARAAYESAKAQVDAINKRLELARLQVDYTELTAPVSGAIAAVDVEVNENVRTGQTVAVLTSGSRAEVHVSIPERLISDIREGDKVTVTFDAIGEEKFTATVSEVGIALTGVATTYPVTVVLDKADERIFSGMVAEVSFIFQSSDRSDRFYVPSVAVGEDRQGRYLFVVNPIESEEGFGKVERRNVAIGELTEDGLEVLTGLEDGDLLVTAGVTQIEDGQKVRILSGGF
ncbi:MAG: efflux RND transporter periplasmic adaptor subunit [candidate division Zixibacteria bacterium]|nr:efflux RND transporter periplasmic adaptor subunit [candidate division Zixibacteria bacterium]